MKQFILAALFSGLSVCSFAQNRIGLEFGVSAPTFAVNSDNQNIGYMHSSTIKPIVGINYLRKIDRHVYIGAKFGLEASSFFFSKTSDTNKVQITHNSTYFTFAPTVDFGLGRYQYMHIYIGLACGFLTSANEMTQQFTDGAATIHYASYNSVNNVNKFIFRPTIGFKQHFPLGKKWHFTLNEGFSFAVTDLTLIGDQGAIHPGAVTLQMGVMRKFHRPKHSVKESPNKEKYQ